MSVSAQPYGSWQSPITADLIAAGTVGLSGICWDGDDLYWTELRGAEGGRNAIVRRTARGIEDALPLPFSARSRVNEYGGGAFTVADGVIYFVNNADQRIYVLRSGAAPEAITPAEKRRYADLVVDHRRQRVIAVCEDHGTAGEPAQSIVAVDISGAAPPFTLASGHDFYAVPRLSPDGDSIAFLAWDHPHMPWDGTVLYIARFSRDGLLQPPRPIAGSETESVVQPRFAPDGDLYFISDRSDWWNLYRYRDGAVTPVWPKNAEFTTPLWVFGLSTYAFVSGNRLACAHNERGMWRLAVLDLESARSRSVAIPHNDISSVQSSGRRVAFLGAGAAALPAVVELDLENDRLQTVRSSAQLALDDRFFSVAEPIEFPTGDGETAHAFLYRPKHSLAIGLPTERPPLIVMSHGGPTTATSPALNLKVQYWTTRGFAVLDVNYRGSTGYGRAYRERLRGSWGVIDVEDCIAGARHLAAKGEVDAARLAIRGGSAGGYTTLCALTFHQVFRAGASHYGISDLELLAHDTHKFESRYMEKLVGPYPQARERYRERSPIHYAERLNCPVIFFQGAEDRVVPPNQTELFVQALRNRRIPVAYLLFPGEQHGFRRAENASRALETELRFYGRVFNFATDVDARVADPLG